MPQFYLNYEYIPVPIKFIEEYMPGANATFVKVYLYALNLAAKGQEVEYVAIAKTLNLLESDVMQCFNYWQGAGVLRVENNAIIFEDLTSGKPGEAKETGKSDKAKGGDRPGYKPGEVALAISENSTLAEMVALAQEILGKTLSPTDTETLYWLYEGLKFSPEVILMLLEYCVSKEKRRMNYIEKVAMSWHEKGITSMEAVNDHIKREAERSGFIYSVRKMLGILDRAMSQSEEQYICRWRDMYNMEADMISLAYEQCIIQTAKLSFPYMEKIMERWYKQGIHTKEQAEADNKNFRNSQGTEKTQKKNFEVYKDEYDHDSLEELTRQ